MNWLEALIGQAGAGNPAVLVTVAGVQGSAPRGTGAKMLVTRERLFDTIGGGHLELRACELARAMLNDAKGKTPARGIERFALGPGLGQCCGGVVHLVFERIGRSALDDYLQLRQRWRARRDTWRVVPLDDANAIRMLGDDMNDMDDMRVAGRDHQPAFDRTLPCHLLRDAQGGRWLIDPCRPWRDHLVLFGAGHVGTAIVRALADLPCHVTWVDEREDMFPPELPPNAVIEATDTPEAAAECAPAGASFLVMTHSHALDQRLCEAILRRADMGWLGLIGSATKRKQFEHRLRERGIGAERLRDMVCPIGIPGITGKAPAVIAASVCAQLLQVWDAAGRAADQAPEAPRKPFTPRASA